jgi:hypothetical protein
MRLLVVLPCLVLGACSTVYDIPATYAPEPSKALDGAKRGANEEKLIGPVEMSEVRQADPLGPGPYMFCIRGANPTVGTRTYAVFFKNNDYVASRMSIMLDHCETQAFMPMGSAPFIDPAVAAAAEEKRKQEAAAAAPPKSSKPPKPIAKPVPPPGT